MHDLVATKGGMMFCTAALISPACRGQAMYANFAMVMFGVIP